MKYQRFFVAVCGVIMALNGATAFAQARLAEAGKAAMPVVVSKDANEQVREAATELADYLGRISGASFEVENGDGHRGIAVGVAEDFPGLKFADTFEDGGLARLEQYALRSHEDGVYVIGASPLAVQHAVWDMLYRLGYRQFFPGPTWEVVPANADLRIKVGIVERPDYFSRRIWYGSGLWDYNAEPFAAWRKRNRADSTFKLRTGHSWGHIYNANKDAFAQHPEYFAQIDGVREYRGGNSKYCISNAALRELVVNDRVATMRRDPSLSSVSIDPSDGGGWCECADCAALGSVSDQAITLANAVARGLVEQVGPDKYVGLYAYNEHSPPPSIEVHPNVVVSIATAFIRGGSSLEQLVAGWGERASVLGIREYYSVMPWDHDLPGRARGGNLDGLATSIPDFYKHRARFMTAESSDNWGANGLGYYLAQRMLWDTGEAEHVDALVDDFLDKAFGDAKEPMRNFYKLIDGSNKPLLSDDMVGRMYRLLQEASGLTDDPAVQARLDDLTLYTHYVERRRAYSESQGKARQVAFEQMMRHAYRMRRTMMVHTKGMYRSVARRDTQVAIPKGAEWNVPEESNPWKTSEPFTRSELDTFVAEGIASHALLEFQSVGFTADLVPTAALKLPATSGGETSWVGRGSRVYYTWIEKAPAQIKLQVTGGMIAHYRDRGDVKIHLYPVDEVEGLAVDQASVPPDGKPRNVVLRTEHVGLHRIEFSDGNDMTKIAWEPRQPMTFESGTAYSPKHTGRQTTYFYVPRGTRVIGGFATNGGDMLDAQGKSVHTFAGPGYFAVDVPPGGDGSLWCLRGYKGQIKLMTVPPYVSHSVQGLLLPREVVKRDTE